MKISLIIQCIDTFGFVPAEDKLRFYADGKRFYPVCKSGGFYIAAKELPNEFTLSIIFAHQALLKTKWLSRICWT